MSMSKTLVLCLGLALGGCASVEMQGAQVADEAVKQAEFVICKSIPVGTWRRHYSGEDKLQAWSVLCTENKVILPEGK